MKRPDWWEWDLAFTSHVEVRMEERGVSEVELRAMLENAIEILPASREGRWLIHARYGGRSWGVVLEPDDTDRVLFVVTVYAREVGP